MKPLHKLLIAIFLVVVATIIAAFAFNAAPRNHLGFETVADMRLFIPPPNQSMLVLGQTSVNDGTPVRTYFYDASSTATDDGDNFIKPTLIDIANPGRYIKINRAQVQPDWNQSSSSAIDFVKNKPTIGSVPQYYGSGGTKSISKVWTGVVSPSTSNGYSIDITSASFASIDNVNVVAARNTATVTSMPNVSIKSHTTSEVVVNVTEANASTTTILGIPVLSGAPNVFANTSGLTLHVRVEGN